MSSEFRLSLVSRSEPNSSNSIYEILTLSLILFNHFWLTSTNLSYGSCAILFCLPEFGLVSFHRCLTDHYSHENPDQVQNDLPGISVLLLKWVELLQNLLYVVRVNVL